MATTPHYTDEDIQEAFITDCFTAQSRTKEGRWRANSKKATDPAAADYVLYYRDWYEGELKDLTALLWVTQPAHAKIITTHHREAGSKEGIIEWRFDEHLAKYGTPEEQERARQGYKAYSELTPEQRKQRNEARAKAEEAERQRDINNAHARYIGAIDIKRYMENEGITNIEDVHPYFKNKKIEAAQGVKLSYFGGVLCVMIPILDISGNFEGVQYIRPDGSKIFSKGQRVGNTEYPAVFYTLCGDIAEPEKRIFIAEGYSTGYSVAEITGFKDTVIVAFNCGNLPIVNRAIRTKHPQAKIAISADNDIANEHGNAGIKAAKECKGAYVVALPDEIAKNGFSDFNDFLCNGSKAERIKQAAAMIEEQIAAQEAKVKAEREQQLRAQNPLLVAGHKAIRRNYKPAKCLIAGWIEEQKISMIFGESGKLKSFTALDMALCITYGISWHNRRVKQADVLYLAGEGQIGLTPRIAAWEQEAMLDNIPLDTNRELQIAQIPQPFTDEGFGAIKETLHYLHKNEIKPELIVVDTLNRFMEGDENSTKDMSRFIQKITALTYEYKTAFLIVHHCGKENKHEPRGSSASFAALDYCFEQTANEVSMGNNSAGGKVIDFNVDIKHTKVKDGKFDKLSVRAYEVEIEGLCDDVGVPLTSLVYKRGVITESKGGDDNEA